MKKLLGFTAAIAAATALTCSASANNGGVVGGVVRAGEDIVNGVVGAGEDIVNGVTGTTNGNNGAAGTTAGGTAGNNNGTATGNGNGAAEGTAGTNNGKPANPNTGVPFNAAAAGTAVLGAAGILLTLRRDD